jgi:hypothetical protein
LVQADKSACNSARQVFARPPFRSFDRIANAYRSSPTIPPAAPTESHQPNRGQIPIETVAPPAPTSRDFVPWRFSDACRPARRCIRHPGVRETLYGALEVKQNNSGHVIFLQPNFFARLESPFLHPDPATSKRCRAQGLSRLAAAQISPHAPAMPGHTLTAPSTAARSLWSG